MNISIKLPITLSPPLKYVIRSSIIRPKAINLASAKSKGAFSITRTATRAVSPFSTRSAVNPSVSNSPDSALVSGSSPIIKLPTALILSKKPLNPCEMPATICSRFRAINSRLAFINLVISRKLAEKVGSKRSLIPRVRPFKAVCTFNNSSWYSAARCAASGGRIPPSSRASILRARKPSRPFLSNRMVDSLSPSCWP